MRKDWIAGLVLLGLAAGYYRMTGDIQRSQLSDLVGAASFPRLLAVCLAILSALLVVTGALKQVSAAKAADTAAAAAEVAQQPAPGDVGTAPGDVGTAPADTRRAFLRAGGTVLIGVGFLLVAPWLGYALAIALLIGAMLLYNRVVLNWKLVLVSVAAGIFFWALFGLVFSIPLPRGVWPRWLGL